MSNMRNGIPNFCFNFSAFVLEFDWQWFHKIRQGGRPPSLKTIGWNRILEHNWLESSNLTCQMVWHISIWENVFALFQTVFQTFSNNTWQVIGWIHLSITLSSRANFNHSFPVAPHRTLSGPNHSDLGTNGYVGARQYGFLHGCDLAKPEVRRLGNERAAPKMCCWVLLNNSQRASLADATCL